MSFVSCVTYIAEAVLRIKTTLNISKIYMFVYLSSPDFFCFPIVKFIMTFVSGPTYVTTPIANSVLRKLKPLSAKFS